MQMLLIEDDHDLRENLAEYFIRNGATVLEADNGKMGLEILSSNHVDLVLSDFQMPILNGMDFLKKAKESLPKCPPVYIMSGYTNFTAQDFINAGAAGYFEKPLSIHFFNEVLKKYNCLK